MSEILQPGHHPDADQLSAFIEHALPAHEYQQTLAHLADCPDCRSVVSLSLPPVNESPILQAKEVRRSWFRGWNLAWPTAAAACAALAVFFVVRTHQTAAHRPSASTAAQMAESHTPAPAAVAAHDATTAREAARRLPYRAATSRDRPSFARLQATRNTFLRLAKRCLPRPLKVLPTPSHKARRQPRPQRLQQVRRPASSASSICSIRLRSLSSGIPFPAGSRRSQWFPPASEYSSSIPKTRSSSATTAGIIGRLFLRIGKAEPSKSSWPLQHPERQTCGGLARSAARWVDLSGCPTIRA